MMTLILVVSFLLIAFVALLRYDIHKHKHRDPAEDQSPKADKKHDSDKKA